MFESCHPDHLFIPRFPFLPSSLADAPNDCWHCGWLYPVIEG